jgi:hypothetical protein
MEMIVMTRLAVLADEIRTESNALSMHLKQTRDSVMKIGNKLIEVRSIVGHGNFLPWVETELEWSKSMAYNFIAIAEAADKFPNFGNLDVPISALYLLAAPNTPDEAVKIVTERSKDGEKLSVEDVQAEIKKAKSKIKPWGRVAKPRDNQAETDILTYKNKTGDWPSRKEGTELTDLSPRNFDNALRAAKAFEAGQSAGATEKMVSIHVLIEKLSPLFDRILAQSKAHRAALSHTELAMIAGEGRRLLDSWASDDPTVRRVRGHVVPSKPPAPKGRKENPKCRDLSLN